MRPPQTQIWIINILALAVILVLLVLSFSDKIRSKRHVVYFDGETYKLNTEVDKLDIRYMPVGRGGTLGRVSQIAGAVRALFSRSGTDSTSQSDVLISNEITIDKSEDVRTLGYSGQRKLAEDETGRSYIAYRKVYKGKYQIFASVLDKREDDYYLEHVIEPISIGQDNIIQRVPGVAIDEVGAVHLVWYGSVDENQDKNRQIQYSRSTGETNVWQSERVISLVSGFSSKFDYWQEHPDIFAGSNNDLFVVWEGKDEAHPTQQAKFSRSLDGGNTWSDWINIKPSGSYSESRPTIVEDSAGRLHVVMYSSYKTLSKTQQIQYTYSDDQGDTWSDLKILSGDDFDARHASISIAGDNVHVAYRSKQKDGDPTRIFYIEGNGDSWSEPVMVSGSESTSYHFFPSISVSLDGNVCIAWNQTRDESSYPSESPESGDIYMSCSMGDVFDSPMKITTNGSNVYANLSLHITSLQRIPIVYYDNDSNKIILRIVNIR